MERERGATRGVGAGAEWQRHAGDRADAEPGAHRDAPRCDQFARVFTDDGDAEDMALAIDDRLDEAFGLAVGLRGGGLGEWPAQYPD